MPTNETVVVFVHFCGATDTHGGLPLRLREEAGAAGIPVEIKEMFLSRSIRLNDAVGVADLARAFHEALEEQLGDLLRNGTRFVCLTQSIGGPIIRDWWYRYYEKVGQRAACPMSHLIMLAPPNFGSALAQVGKQRFSHLKCLEGMEMGQGVLDWFELGSAQAWDLNTAWIRSDGSQIGPEGLFPFVLTGQSIDRVAYDPLNSYTGEMGSDGFVRTAAANLCGTYIRVVQETPKPQSGGTGELAADKMRVFAFKRAPKTALRIISKKSHAGARMGITSSVKQEMNDKNSKETIDAILACIQVKTIDQYQKLCDRFFEETKTIQKQERLEVENELLGSKTPFFNDRYSMVIFRVRDDEDHPVTDFDLILTAGPHADPNHFPRGFCVDRQRNRVNPETITYFFNYDVLNGAPAVRDGEGKMVRKKMEGVKMLGFRIVARPDDGLVHFLPGELQASEAMFKMALDANSTTLFDIRLRRVVGKIGFLLKGGTDEPKPV